MRRLDVRKQGKLCTVFVEALTNTPIPFNDFNNPPAHGFPFSMPEAEVKMRYPGYDTYNFIEDLTIPPQPTVARKDHSREIDRIMKENVAAQHTSKPNVAPSSGDLEKAIGFYKLLLAQQSFADGVHATTLEIKVETCAKLIKSIWSNSDEALASAKQAVESLAI